MAAAEESDLHRPRRSEHGKTWYKYNLDVPGAADHIEKFLSDYQPSKFAKTTRYVCLGIGFYGEFPPIPGISTNQGNDHEPSASETQPGGEGPAGDGAPEQTQDGQLVLEWSENFVVYREAGNSEGPDSSVAPKPRPDFIPKVRNQAKLEKRNKMKAEIRVMAEQGLTKRSLLTLAEKYEFLYGGWMFYVATGHRVDWMWRKLTLALADGTLPAKRIQVWPRDDDAESREHLMGVHCADFRNEGCVLQLEKALRQVGVRQQMFLKPAIYVLGRINAGNPYRIHPSLKISNFSVASGASTILSPD